MTRRSFTLALMALIAIVLPFTSGCDQKRGAASGASWSSIPPDRASALIKTGGVDLILDVRTKGEFASGAIENAMLIPIDALASNLEKIAAYKDKTVIVYCRSGNRSSTASKFLAGEGFTHILNMSGGTTSWSQAGLPLVRQGG